MQSKWKRYPKKQQKIISLVPKSWSVQHIFLQRIFLKYNLECATCSMTLTLWPWPAIDYLFFQVLTLTNNCNGKRQGTNCGSLHSQKMVKHSKLIVSSATGKLITAKDHASVQINIGDVDSEGRLTGTTKTYALSGFVRSVGEADDSLNRLTTTDGYLKKYIFFLINHCSVWSFSK